MAKKDFLWVILTKDKEDYHEWGGVVNRVITKCPCTAARIVLVNPGDKGALREEVECLDQMNSSTTLCRCWVHFGGNDYVLCFSRDHWMNHLKSLFEEENLPALLRNADFAPYSKGAAQEEWQEEFLKLAPEMKELLKNQDSDSEKAKAIKSKLESLWQQAMEWRDKAPEFTALHDLMPVAIYCDGYLYARENATDKVDAMQSLIIAEIPAIVTGVNAEVLDAEGQKQVSNIGKVSSQMDSEAIGYAAQAFMSWYHNVQKTQSNDG